MNTQSNLNSNGNPVRRVVRTRPTSEAATARSLASGKPKLTGMKLVEAARHAKPHHHITDGSPQSRGRSAKDLSGPSELPGANALANPLRAHLPRPAASPILVGDRQTLRALREAEMQAWNAGYPTGSEVQTNTSRSVAAPPPRLPAPERSRNDAWGLFILALCAAAGLLVGMRDLGSFIAGWSRMMEGIRLVIR